jgi:hypothetical protein
MRSFWINWWALNPVISVLIKGRKRTGTLRRKSHCEGGGRDWSVMRPQAKECLESPETEKSQEDFRISQGSQRDRTSSGVCVCVCVRMPPPTGLRVYLAIHLEGPAKGSTHHPYQPQTLQVPWICWIMWPKQQNSLPRALSYSLSTQNKQFFSHWEVTPKWGVYCPSGGQGTITLCEGQFALLRLQQFKC